MGRRRKRGDSENDESLEQRYSQTKGNEKEANSVKPKKDDPEIGLATKTSEEEQQRIERLRLKKKRRKELKKGKDQDRNEQINGQQQQQQQQQKSISKDPKTATSKSKISNDNTFVGLQKGVQYRDVVVGKGPVVQDRKKIRVAYVLRAKQRYGKILDTSNDFRFRVGRGEVIKGWDIGVLGMRQGGKRHLIVPPQAGYGQRNVGAGKGGMLFFEVTVLDC